MAEKKARLSLKGMPLDAVVEQMNQKFGANTLIRGDKADGTNIKFISTGIYGIDFGLGGGIPENRITQVHGPFSSLKSTLSLMAARQFLAKYKDGIVIFVDVEKTWTQKYTKSLGVDLKRFFVANVDSGEQTVDVVTELLDLGRPVLMIVDSIAAMTPTGEVEGSAENQTMGVHARLINKLMRVAVARMKRDLYDSDAASTTLIVLNQEREKLGVMFGDPLTTPGGKGKDFAISVNLRMFSSPSDRVMEKVKINGVERDIRFAQNVKYVVRKNKCSSSQYESGSFVYFVKEYKGHEPHTIDNEEALFLYGVFYGVIDYVKGQYKSKYISKAYAEPAFKKALLNDPIAQQHIYADVIEAITKDNDGEVTMGVTVEEGEQAVVEVDLSEDKPTLIKKPKQKKMKLKMKGARK